MDVITYQLVILISISFVYFISRKWAFYVAIGWTIETLIFLFYPPLIGIQLFVIWGTYFALRKFVYQSEKIVVLEKDIEDIEKDSKKEVIVGNQHSQILLDTLKNANKRVCIISGWISHYVVDSLFCDLLSKALERGVDIYIGYGWQDSTGKHNSSEKALMRLRSLSQKFAGSITIGEFPTHEKLLVKDNDYVIYGSNNWLSNKKFKNSERSIIQYSRELAEKEANHAIKVITGNKVH